MGGVIRASLSTWTSGAALVALPKCPACLAAYTAVLGFSFPFAAVTALRCVFGFAFVGACFWLGVTVFVRLRSPRGSGPSGCCPALPEAPR